MPVLLERFAPLVLKAIHFLLPWRQFVNLTKSHLRDTSRKSSSSRNEVTVPGRPISSKPMIRGQNRVNNGNFWGCRNTIPGFFLHRMLEPCNSLNDSPLVEPVESASGENLRTSFWNGYDLTDWRGHERFYLFWGAKRPRHVWFSSPCRIPGASWRRVSYILQGLLDVIPRVQTLGCHVHFAQPLTSACWNQISLLDTTENTLIVNGCTWCLRDAQRNLLNQSWQILTTFLKCNES